MTKWEWHVFVLVLLIPGAWSGRTWKSLYPEGESSVEELGPFDLERIMAQEDVPGVQPILIEFYAPWCGHCQHFAPQYEKVAKHFKDVVDVRITALDCVHFKDLCKKQHVDSYPTLKVFHAHRVAGSFSPQGLAVNAKHRGSAKVLVDWLHEHVTTPHENSGGGGGSSSSSSSSLVTEANGGSGGGGDKEGYRVWSDLTSPRSTPPAARLHDAVSSLLFGFHYGVFTDGDKLEGARLAAFRTFLKDIAKVFPGDPANREALRALSHQVASDRSLLLHSKGWDDYTAGWRLGLFPNSFKWSPMCDPASLNKDKGSEQHVTMGYTCGLWTLFHMLTFSASTSSVTPNEILYMVRNYVANFFGCSHCRDHFLEMFDGCLFDRCSIPDGNSPESQKAAVLWLWKAHNTVNVRVAEESYDDTQVKKSSASQRAWMALWPSRRLCPGCWPPNSTLIDNPHLTALEAVEAVRWNEDEVVVFLRDAYSSSDGMTQVAKKTDTTPFRITVPSANKGQSRNDHLHQTAGGVVMDYADRGDDDGGHSSRQHGLASGSSTGWLGLFGGLALASFVWWVWRLKHRQARGAHKKADDCLRRGHGCVGTATP